MIFKLNNLFLNNKLSQLICKNKSTASILILREKSQFMQTCTDIVWMDLEMTGLDVLNDKIIEVSSVITDKEMNIIAEGPCFAVHHPAVVFENLNSWCKKHHYESGLVEKCLKSQITTSKGQELLLDFFKAYIPKGECALAGNSVYMDRLFLRKEMPEVDDYLHYRIIDVSTIKELARRWNPKVLAEAPTKKLAHRSLDDIKDSIEELKYYRHAFFK